MSSVLADFTGRFNSESDKIDGPAKGRVLLGEGQLVLAASDSEKEAIPLDHVVDISLDSVPQLFDTLPGRPVTVAYSDGDQSVAALIAADEQTIGKFSTVLFKAVLNGTHVTLKHPAKLGGRVLDTEFQGGILSLQAGTVQFQTEEGPVIIDLDAVVDFSRETRNVDGQERPVLAVSHMHNVEGMTTVAATESRRELSILGRYLRQKYEKFIASLQNISLSNSETELLTTIYSTGDQDVALSNVLGVDPQQVKHLLHALHEKELVESGQHSPVLTSKGQVVVNHYLERINE